MPVSEHPITDHLWQLGFDLKRELNRYPEPIVQRDAIHGDTILYCSFKVTAYPERGEARRLFGRKGPAASMVSSNLPLEEFGAEKDRGETQLRDIYTEKCAEVLLDMLRAADPTVSQPKQKALA